MACVSYLQNITYQKKYITIMASITSTKYYSLEKIHYIMARVSYLQNTKISLIRKQIHSIIMAHNNGASFSYLQTKCQPNNNVGFAAHYMFYKLLNLRAIENIRGGFLDSVFDAETFTSLSSITFLLGVPGTTAAHFVLSRW